MTSSRVDSSTSSSVGTDAFLSLYIVLLPKRVTQHILQVIFPSTFDVFFISIKLTFLMYTKVRSGFKTVFQFVNFHISDNYYYYFFFLQMYSRRPSTVAYLHFHPMAVFSFDFIFYLFLFINHSQSIFHALVGLHFFLL